MSSNFLIDNPLMSEYKIKKGEPYIEPEFFSFECTPGIVLGYPLTPAEEKLNPLYNIITLNKALGDMINYDLEHMRSGERGLCIPRGPFRWQAPLNLNKGSDFGEDMSYMPTHSYDSAVYNFIVDHYKEMTCGKEIDFMINKEIIDAFNIYLWARAIRMKLLILHYGYERATSGDQLIQKFLEAPLLVQEVHLVSNLIAQYKANWEECVVAWVNQMRSVYDNNAMNLLEQFIKDREYVELNVIAPWVDKAQGRN